MVDRRHRRCAEAITSIRKVEPSDAFDIVVLIGECLCLIGYAACPVKTGCAPLDKNPAAKRLFETVQIPIADMNEVILRQHEGENSEEQIMQQARDWVAAHEQQFDAWVKEAAAAQ